MGKTLLCPLCFMCVLTIMCPAASVVHVCWTAYIAWPFGAAWCKQLTLFLDAMRMRSSWYGRGAWRKARSAMPPDWSSPLRRDSGILVGAPCLNIGRVLLCKPTLRAWQRFPLKRARNIVGLLLRNRHVVSRGLCAVVLARMQLWQWPLSDGRQTTCIPVALHLLKAGCYSTYHS
jgi:hypothetical protein